MSLKARLKQLEGRQTTHTITIWAVIFGEASPDELDDEGRAMCEFLLTPTLDDEYDPIEARIQAEEAKAIPARSHGIHQWPVLPDGDVFNHPWWSTNSQRESWSR